MGGNERIFLEVKRLWNQAAALDISLEVAWRSRWDPQQQLADSLEKQYDDSDWQLHDHSYQWLLGRQELDGRTPTLDVFAAEHNTKLPGAFYSRWDYLGSLGVNAFRHPWAYRNGVRQLCYINGPFGSMGTILKKIRAERCDALIVYPVRHQYWRAMLRSLPVQMDVKLRPPTGQDLFIPSVRVDPRKRKSAVQFIARAALICWQQRSRAHDDATTIRLKQRGQGAQQICAQPPHKAILGGISRQGLDDHNGLTTTSYGLGASRQDHQLGRRLVGQQENRQSTITPWQGSQRSFSR
ncbi:hypothetical protein COCOBI_02-6650 [Coccomyxa sp. Obi]|nr:hypothetical protein COCOBI_02-6650 [Coccomyxa sp. Obi]